MRKIIVAAFAAALVLAGLATVAYIVIPLSYAQGDAVPALGPEVTFGWVVVSWLIYSIAGLLASLTTPTEKFDAVKFARSLLIMVLTGFMALAFGISPANVETQFGGFITAMANGIVNTAPGVTLIYILNKSTTFIMNLKAKIEAAKAQMATGPPKPLSTP